MSETLLRQIRLNEGVHEISLVENASDQPDEVLFYLGLTNNTNPVRIAISETEVNTQNSFVDVSDLLPMNNSTLLIENSFENIQSAKLCLDNWVNEQPTCMGASNEALIDINLNSPDDIFPLELKINDDIIIFPENTDMSEFLAVLKTYGLELLPTFGE